jgi:hypothetical protein
VDQRAVLGGPFHVIHEKEFPHLPERVAHTLQQLRNEALELEARADLKTAAAVREQLEERLRAATERASKAAATSK